MRYPGGGSSPRLLILSRMFAHHFPPLPLGPSPCPRPSVSVSPDSREFAPFGPPQGRLLSPPRAQSPPPNLAWLPRPGGHRASIGTQPEVAESRWAQTACSFRLQHLLGSRPAPMPRPHDPRTRAVNPLATAPGRAPPRGHAPTGVSRRRLTPQSDRRCGGRAPPQGPAPLKPTPGG